MSVKVNFNVSQFKQQLSTLAEQLNKATRPAAQAGAQIIYDRAKLLAPVSEKSHKFHGTNKVYGPYSPGTLRDSIYQVFSKDNSYKDTSTYHISWNADEAPYGGMVEFGTVKAPARSFIGLAVKETRCGVRRAIKDAFLKEFNSK